MSSITKIGTSYMVNMPKEIITVFGLKIRKETGVKYDWINLNGFPALRERPPEPKKEVKNEA